MIEITRLLLVVENKEKRMGHSLRTGQRQRCEKQRSSRCLKTRKRDFPPGGYKHLSENFQLRMTCVKFLEFVNIHKNRVQKYKKA